jgi:DNA-binding FrmR family transcriptional regulator
LKSKRFFPSKKSHSFNTNYLVAIMKYSFALACLAVETLAYQPLVVRDIQTVNGVLADVKSNLENMNSVVKSSGNGNDPEPLLKASNGLLQTLDSGKTTIDGSSDLTLADAMSLTGPVKDLNDVGRDLASNLKGIRSNIEKQGQCKAVRVQISSIKSKSDALVQAVISKVPAMAQNIAKSMSSELASVLQQSEQDFSEQNCKDSVQAAPSEPAGIPTYVLPGASSTAAAPAEPTSVYVPAPASSASSEVVSATAPVSAVVPATTAAHSTTLLPTAVGNYTVIPTGTLGTSGSSPVVTAGAAVLAPAGAFALAAVAALFV